MIISLSTAIDISKNATQAPPSKTAVEAASPELSLGDMIGLFRMTVQCRLCVNSGFALSTNWLLLTHDKGSHQLPITPWNHRSITSVQKDKNAPDESEEKVESPKPAKTDKDRTFIIWMHGPILKFNSCHWDCYFQKRDIFMIPDCGSSNLFVSFLIRIEHCSIFVCSSGSVIFCK